MALLLAEAMLRRTVLLGWIAALVSAMGCRSASEPLPEATPAQSAAVGDGARVADAPSASGSAGANAATSASAAASGPIVDLSGASHPPAPIAPVAPRLAARAMLVPVFEKAHPDSKKIGHLRAGAVVALAPTADAGTAGCVGGWRAIQPAGFVCLDDKATLDLEDPIVRATARRPDASQKLPYMYGTVTRGGPAYGRIPTAADLEKHEPNLDKHIDKWRKDEVSGAGYGLELWYKWREAKPSKSAFELWEAKVTDDDIPFYLRDGGSVPNLSGVAKGAAAKIDEVERRQGAAFIDSFLHEGRRYNVTTDLRLVPADRYRPIKGSDFHGVRIGVDVDFPFALVRKQGGKMFTWSTAKERMVEAKDLEWRAAIALTGEQRFSRGVLHYETKDGHWVDDRHAGRIDPAKRMPKWGKNGERWIDINITKQTLVAYEGEKAVYATLVSTGEDGLDHHEGTRATKKGIFRIHTKFVTTTMDSDTSGEEFELRDVPYVQYFEDGYALHGAYWHDAFGMPKSHGCINLSPEDARRLFFWTEPQVPVGWHGAARPLTGTVVFVHP